MSIHDRRSQAMFPIENDEAIRTMLQQFVADADALYDMLRAPAPSSYELLLLGEMRQTIRALSDVLHAAAEIEGNGTRAADFFTASAVAAEVAAVPQSLRLLLRSDH